MKLHVLTAVTRPENLPRIARSLANAAGGLPITVSWHWRFDLEHSAVGGQNIKNELLEGITEGWVWVLDDDTLVHRDLFRRWLEHHPDSLDAFIVSQRRSEGWVLHAAAQNVCVGGIDAGQAIMRRSLIGATLIPDDYNGDGMWLGQILPRAQDPFYLDEVLSLHNALT